MTRKVSSRDMFAKNKVIVRLELRRSIWLNARDKILSAPNSILIVGDRPGPSAPKEPHYHHTPFYSTKHCSGWLNTALEVEKIPEKALVWINSADENGKDYDIDIATNVGARKIIALGAKAAKWLDKNGVIDFVETYHPQYWKRFHSKERYPLLDLILNCGRSIIPPGASIKVLSWPELS